MTRLALLLCLALACASIFSAHAAPQSCEQLAQLALPNTTITSAQTVAAGAFTPPTATSPWLVGDPSFYKQLPAFCRVTAVDKPTPDSDIKLEAWMPATGWNGKFRGQGNGGFAGEMDYRSMAIAISHGYATAATDTGHAASGVDATWALGHPEKIIDFAYRAIHEMTSFGRASVTSFYGKAPQHAYFAACSNGGRQALMEAQRYPDDYDGILAGAPANWWTHLLTSAIFDAQATTLDPESYIPASKIPAISHAVLAACDAKDGVKDGVLNDPRQCHFDPAAMLCKQGNSDSCLTQPQVTALKKLYEGGHDAAGKQVFPGFVPGGEEGEGGWVTWITGDAPGKGLLFAFGNGYFSDMVYSKADWDYKQVKLDEVLAASDQEFSSVLNSFDSNMKAFQSRGGKVIIYHGWNDAAISPLSAINYYDSVVKTMGQREADSFVRLYMVPGLQHCAGGPGTDVFGQIGISTAFDARHDIYLAVEDWVEKGTAPSTIIAAKLDAPGPSGKVTMSRPLCAYPQQAKYKGTGDPNDAANFTCTK